MGLAHPRITRRVMVCQRNEMSACPRSIGHAAGAARAGTTVVFLDTKGLRDPRIWHAFGRGCELDVYASRIKGPSRLASNAHKPTPQSYPYELPPYTHHVRERYHRNPSCPGPPRVSAQLPSTLAASPLTRSAAESIPPSTLLRRGPHSLSKAKLSSSPAPAAVSDARRLSPSRRLVRPSPLLRVRRERWRRPRRLCSRRCRMRRLRNTS